MLPLIQAELIRMGWLNHHQFLEILAVAEMTPGPMALNTATFVGFRIGSIMHNGSLWLAFVGALVGTVAVSAPSWIFVNIVGNFWHRYKDHLFMTNLFDILRPLISGLVLGAALLLVHSITNWDLKHPLGFKTIELIPLLIMTGAFILSAFSRISPFYILIAGALAGIITHIGVV